MNLNLKVYGEKFDLYQTPTDVSYACIKPIGKKNPSVNEILARYETWLMGFWNGDRDLRKQSIEHVEHIRTLINTKGSKPEFWVM